MKLLETYSVYSSSRTNPVWFKYEHSNLAYFRADHPNRFKLKSYPNASLDSWKQDDLIYRISYETS